MLNFKIKKKGEKNPAQHHSEPSPTVEFQTSSLTYLPFLFSASCFLHLKQLVLSSGLEKIHK